MSGENFSQCGGFQIPSMYRDIWEQIDNFQVYEDDIWVTSIPCSGKMTNYSLIIKVYARNHVEEMVWMIANNLNFEKGQVVTLDERFPFLEASIDYNFGEDAKKSAKIPPFLSDSIGFVKSLKAPRFIKTHLSFPLLPRQIREGLKKPKIICVLRDPKDVCVSSYYKMKNKFMGTFEDYCKAFISKKKVFTSYWDHVLSYRSHESDSNIHLITYEEMKNDLPRVITQVSEFLNVFLESHQLKILENHLSFESMKENPSVNKEWKNKLLERDFGSCMRSGNVGDYKNEMSPGIIEEFEEWSRIHSGKGGL